MRYIIEYELDNHKIPNYIENGGYFYNGDKLIGLTKDLSSVPIGGKEIKASDLKAKLLSMPFKKLIEVELDDNEKNTMVDNFFSEMDAISITG